MEDSTETATCEVKITDISDNMPQANCTWPDNPVDSYLRNEVVRLTKELLDGMIIDNNEKGKLVRELYKSLQNSLYKVIKLNVEKQEIKEETDVKSNAKKKQRKYPSGNTYDDDITIFVYNCFGKCIPEASRKKNFPAVVYAWSILKLLESGSIKQGTLTTVSDIHKSVSEKAGNVIPGITGHILRWSYSLIESCCDCVRKVIRGQHNYAYSFSNLREDWEEVLEDDVRRSSGTLTDKVTSVSEITGNLMLELE